MVVEQSNIDHIMRGLQSTEGVRLHNHRKKLRQRFDIIKKLGQGTYGKVQLGINKETGQEVAIKTIKKCKIETEADLVRIRREIQIMSSVRHPNIIHIYEVFENREKMVLVMEYAAGGELYDFLSERKVLEETEARRIFRQISTAVYYCHKHKICHRDLKLENILLDEHGSAKIADFGLSNVFDEQRLLNTFCGSPLYASPEIVKGTPYHGPEVDCWSLGVLLYTLVYGAMPFDGSNFKRLVKQISQGDYFEPKKASPASPLIREMLTVNPAKRATIENICSHWWVNQGFNVSCLDIAEDLANQTPVRLDLLLSLAPPPENSEKLVVTDDQNTTAQEAPTRSMSVGSFMELDPNTEQRIRDFVAQEVPSDNNNTNEKTIKRKLETGPSESSVTKGGARKKERIKQSDQLKEVDLIPETVEQSANKVESNNVVMDVDSEGNKIVEKDEKLTTDTSANVEVKKLPEETEKVPTETKEAEKPAAEAEKSEKEAISKDKPTRKSVKKKVSKVSKDSDAEKKEEGESTDAKVKMKIKKKKSESPVPVEEEPKRDVKREDRKSESKEKEEVGKEIKREGSTRKSRGNLKLNISQEKEKSQTPTTPDDAPAKPMERRKSKVFETAEKFLTNEPRSPTQEKPKKVFIPGVKVSDFAKAFERRSSVTSAAPERRPSVTSTKPVLKSSPSKKLVNKDPAESKSEEKPEKLPDTKKDEEISSQNESQSEAKAAEAEKVEETPESNVEERKMTEIDDDKIKKLKESARNIIQNALVEEERKKIKKQILKPPVPKAKSEDLENKKKALTLQIGKETATVQVHTPENTKFLFEPEAEAANENKENIETPKEKKTAKVEITLKSNTLPRKTSKAEIQLTSPPQQGKDSGSFRTEVEHRVGDPNAAYSTQRSEVAFPVSAAQRPIRSMSLEPENRRPQHQSSKERIIPIKVEDGPQKEEQESRDRVKELERPLSQTESRTKFPYQRTLSQRSSSLSRQGTQDSDTESTVSASGEPIRKSPREFIIPIAVEGGGYITPRATSLEPSDSMSSKRSHRPFGRKISLLSDNGSEDENPFSTLQRHPSRDLDEPFRLHRLRSTRPTRSSVERADSASGSEEEEEDDDGFEILTAENLFSTLLSRVRSLTQRLNVEDGMRPGFPTSRLMMNHFGPSERLFSNIHQPLTRLSERPEFSRSMGRDVENGLNRWSRGDLSDSESSRSIPRGHSKIGRSESDTDSISESSTLPGRKKSKTHGEKKHRRSHSHSRQRSVPVSLTENEEVTEYVPTYDGNKSLYVPSHRVLISKSQKRNSDSDLTEGGAAAAAASSNVPKLKRTTSLKTDGPKRRPERKSIGILEECLQDHDVFTERDFYDILAEKYGITNVKRYDLPPSENPSEFSVKRRTNDGSKSKLNENRRSLISLTEVDQKEKLKTKLSNSEQNLNEMENDRKGKKEKDILPPLPPKPKKEEFKTPSEKLAAVLNRLESNYEKTAEKKPERGIPNDLLYGKKEGKKEVKSRAGSVAKETPKPELRKIESERLAELSPKALELYEKTLGLYQKTLEKSKKQEKNEEEQKKIPETVTKIALPRKIMTRHSSDMSLKYYDKYDVPTKEMLMHPEHYRKIGETPERSVLSKYFHYASCEDGLKNNSDQYFKDKKLKHYGSLQLKLDEDVGNKSDVEVTVTVKLPEKLEKVPERRKSVKRLSKTETGDKEKSPEKKKVVKVKDEEDKKKAVRIKRLSKDLESELNKMEVEKETEEVWKKREDLPVPIPVPVPLQDPVPVKVPAPVPVQAPAPAPVPVPAQVTPPAPVPVPVPVSETTKKDERVEKPVEKLEKPEKPEKPAIPEKPDLSKTGKNKFLSSLEKKLEKFRAPDKNYVDKAIRSLRESSLGPKDVVCENVLIKRAVSLSDCSVVKPTPPGRIQSTVNSVLGIFKKFENTDGKNKKTATDDINLKRRTSVPTLLHVKKTDESEPEISSPQTPKPIPKIIADNDGINPEIPNNSSRRQSAVSGYGNDISINKSSSPILGFDDSSSFLSPDSESFDSWSNCSDFGTPDEFVPNLRTISPILKLANLDDVVGESVGDRIRRKSFYTRFNERKKPRKSAILEGRKKYDQAMFEETQKEGSVREKHSYNRTLSQNLDKPRVQQSYSRSLSSADYSRPKPFYKVGSKSPTNETPTSTPVYRKTSLDWPKSLVTSPTFARSVSQSSSGSNYSSTNPNITKNYLGSYDNIRMRRPESVYSPRSSDLERAFSPIPTFSPNRTLSPTFGFRRSPSTSALD